MDLITLQEYKEYNLIGNPTGDAKIQTLIPAVSSLIKAYLGFDFEGGGTYTENIMMDYDTPIIYLDRYPLTGTVTITETGRITTDSTVHVPLTGAVDYSINMQDGIITRLYTPGGFASWPIAPGYITITYTTAPRFSTTPADLKLAAMELVSYYRNEEYKQSKSIQGASITNTMVSADLDFPKHIQVILDRYRNSHI